MTSPTNETQSIHRAISILDCFGDVQPELGVGEIAWQLELHPRKVGRMLATLTSLESLRIRRITAIAWDQKIEEYAKLLMRVTVNLSISLGTPRKY